MQSLIQGWILGLHELNVSECYLPCILNVSTCALTCTCRPSNYLNSRHFKQQEMTLDQISVLSAASKYQCTNNAPATPSGFVSAGRWSRQLEAGSEPLLFEQIKLKVNDTPTKKNTNVQHQHTRRSVMFFLLKNKCVYYYVIVGQWCVDNGCHHIG